MGKRFDTLLFPGGKSKAFTLSYDDGVVQDRRLAALFRQYGLKCSFNLGSGLLGHKETGRAPGRKEIDVSKVSPEEVPEASPSERRGRCHCGSDNRSSATGLYADL